MTAEEQIQFLQDFAGTIIFGLFGTVLGLVAISLLILALYAWREVDRR